MQKKPVRLSNNDVACFNANPLTEGTPTETFLRCANHLTYIAYELDQVGLMVSVPMLLSPTLHEIASSLLHLSYPLQPSHIRLLKHCINRLINVNRMLKNSVQHEQRVIMIECICSAIEYEIEWREEL